MKLILDLAVMFTKLDAFWAIQTILVSQCLVRIVNHPDDVVLDRLHTGVNPTAHSKAFALS